MSRRAVLERTIYFCILFLFPIFYGFLLYRTHFVPITKDSMFFSFLKQVIEAGQEYASTGRILLQEGRSLGVFTGGLLYYGFSVEPDFLFALFAGMACFFNLLGWSLFGWKYGLSWKALSIGALFFFWKDTQIMLTEYADVNVLFATAALPFLLYYAYVFMMEGKLDFLVHYTIAMGMLLFLDGRSFPVIACLAIVGAFFIGIGYNQYRRTGGICAVTLAILGLGYSYWSAASEKLMQERMMETASVGAFSVAICLAGIFLAKKENLFGYILFFMTALGMLPFVKNRIFDGDRSVFLPALVQTAGAVLFLSILLWKRIRPISMFVFALLFVMELYPTLQNYNQEKSWVEYQEDISNRYFLEEAKAAAHNGIDYIENTNVANIATYEFSKTNENNAWVLLQSNEQNIIEEAAIHGFMDYVFEQEIIHGIDTILIGKDLEKSWDNTLILTSADRNGYEILMENRDGWLLRLQESQWNRLGTEKQFENLAIGKNALALSIIDTSFGYSENSDLETYSIEYLSSFDTLYVTDLSATDLDKTEEILKEVAGNGTRIILDMQSMPQNKVNGRRELLSVSGKDVTITSEEGFFINPKKAGETSWETVRLELCDQSLGQVVDSEGTIWVYYGKEKTLPIYYMGFNAVYYYYETMDADTYSILNQVFHQGSLF